jgi:uncharacterized membrane protein
MKYTLEVTVNLPLDRVIELFDSAENLPKWQPGLQSFEPLSGAPGQPGAKSSLLYDENGRKIEMVETIIKRDFPDEFSALYEAKGVKNWTVNHFYSDGTDKTRWVMDNEFKFSGLMALMGIFMRGSFPKETLKQMNQFKAFAESA